MRVKREGGGKRESERERERRKAGRASVVIQKRALLALLLTLTLVVPLSSRVSKARLWRCQGRGRGIWRGGCV
jgi:hypothetical protein